MLKFKPKKHLVVKGNKKVWRILAPTFFLCTLAPFSAFATSNFVNGTAYGTNATFWATSNSISSVTDGTGSLSVGFSGTTNIMLSHTINGSIIISNNFTGFTIDATGATVNSPSSTALTIAGGSLTITGGNFTETASANSALFATNTSLTIKEGTFTGNPANSAALFTINSDVLVEDGTFVGGKLTGGNYFGLFSRTEQGLTNNIALNGGTFSLLGFDGEGLQFLTAGTNLAVQQGIVQFAGTLVVTNQSDAPFQTNTVMGGTMRFINNFDLTENGELVLASTGSRVNFDGDFTVSSNATLFVAGTTNSEALITAENISFQTNSTLVFSSEPEGLTAGSSATSTVVSATSNLYVITSGGATNTATAGNFAENVNIQTNTMARTGLAGIIIDGSSLKARFATKALKDYWSASGDFATLADELDGLSPTEMLANIDTIRNPTISGQLVEQTYFTAINTFQTSLNGLRTAVGLSEARSAEFRAQLGLTPLGARGPQRRNDTRGWAKYYAQYLTHDEQGLSDAYNTVLQGGVFGIDHSFGNLLLGISGGSGIYSTMYDNDAEEDVTAYHGAVYGTYGGERVYIDLGAAYGHGEVDTQTAAPFILNGEFETRMASAYIGAGIDLIDEAGGTTFTPAASIHYAMYEQDAYTETGTAAVPRSIEAFEANSLRSSVGLNVSMLNRHDLETFGFKLDGRLHWMHEFNPEPGNADFSLEGGTATYQLAYPTLDEDLFRVGVGCSFFNSMRNKPKNVLFRADFDELFGDGLNSHNVSAKVVYAF